MMNYKIISQLSAKDQLYLMVCKNITDDALEKLLAELNKGVPGKLTLLKELYEKGTVFTKKQLIKIAVNFQADKYLLKDIINKTREFANKNYIKLSKEIDFKNSKVLPKEKFHYNQYTGDFFVEGQITPDESRALLAIFKEQSDRMALSDFKNFLIEKADLLDYMFDQILPVIETLNMKLWLEFNGNHLLSPKFSKVNWLLNSFSLYEMMEDDRMYSSNKLLEVLATDTNRVRQLFDKTYDLLKGENLYTEKSVCGYDHPVRNILFLCAKTGKLIPNQYTQLLLEHNENMFFAFDHDAKREADRSLSLLITDKQLDEKKLNKLFNKLFEHYLNCTKKECEDRLLYFMVKSIQSGNIKNLWDRQVLFDHRKNDFNEITEALKQAKQNFQKVSTGRS
ncbi:MAG: hypothetical protein PHV30_09715 [Candidatus Margulisbacteria bacterium]|nr:hypothetical protein [Candidatus Margulisiibacteriota bacterium]